MRSNSEAKFSTSGASATFSKLPPRYPAPKNVLYGVSALIVLTAAWMSLGRFEHGHNADSIVPVLVSLQHWTPFFWETNRYGMLVPLLTAPFRNPLTNLILQTALSTGAGLAASFLLLRYFFADLFFWLTAAALQNIWLLLLVPRYTQFDWFVVQCYGVSFTLAFFALIMLQKQRVVLALVLMLLSHWVNSAVFIVLIPLIVQRHLIDRQRRGLFWSLGIVLAGAAGGFALMITAQFRTTQSGLAPMSTWVQGWLEMVHVARGGVLTNPLYGLWVIIPASLGLITILLLRSGKRVLLVCVALVNTAVFYWLFTGTLAWVQANLYGARYIYPSLLLITTVMALLAVAPFERIFAQKRVVVLGAAGLMFLAAAFAFGRPSISWIQRDIHQRFGSMTSEIVASRALLVSGKYWIVWPAVFDANLALYQQGEHRMVYGLTYRGTGTMALWSARPQVCVDVPQNDPDGPSYMRDTGRHFQVTRTFNTLTMFCTN